MRRLLATLAIATAIAAPASSAAAGATPHAAGDAALREATRLSVTWGRCPTARPAHRALRVARTATGPRRPPAARRARDAWRRVAVVCARPAPPMPVADPSA